MKDEKSQQEILKQGQTSEFWQLILEFIGKSKNDLRVQQDADEFRDLPADQYKIENELLKAKIKYLDRLASYPNSIIGWLQNPNTKETNYDPYD